MDERTPRHELLLHMRQVAEIVGFGTGIPFDNLVEATGEFPEVLERELNLLRERGLVSQDSPTYGSGWWITGPGYDRLETLEFFGY